MNFFIALRLAQGHRQGTSCRFSNNSEFRSIVCWAGKSQSSVASINCETFFGFSHTSHMGDDRHGHGHCVCSFIGKGKESKAFLQRFSFDLQSILCCRSNGSVIFFSLLGYQFCCCCCCFFFWIESITWNSLSFATSEHPSFFAWISCAVNTKELWVTTKYQIPKVLFFSLQDKKRTANIIRLIRAG